VAPGVGYDFRMAKTADDLRDEVLALPAQDRARIASDLLASLDEEQADEVEVDRWWSAETERRAALLESGEAQLVTWAHVLERVDARRAQRQV
jgi:putative addiction module component (TIGR02574 family)